MIAIVSSSAPDRAALVALCESRGWVAVACNSIRSVTRLLQRSPPRSIVMRHSCSDGFSDQVFAHLGAAQAGRATRCIVLVAASTPPAGEARQINLGADCVLRDPIRTDLLLAYLAKYQRDSQPASTRSRSGPGAALPFAGGALHRGDRKLRKGGKTAPLTPREIELIELLVGTAGTVVSYETLYSEILNRPFRGDTSNMRVLLGKLTTSAATIGLAVRSWVEVIPKTGYRYRAPPPATRTRRAPAPRAPAT